MNLYTYVTLEDLAVPLGRLRYICNPGRVSELNFLFMSYRYTAIGLECGTFITFIVDLESNEVVEKLTFSFEGPLTKVIFFPTEGNRLGLANKGPRLFKLNKF